MYSIRVSASFFFPSRRTGKEEVVFTKQCVCKIFVEVFLSLCLHLKRLSLPSLLSPLTCPLTSRQFEFKKFQLKQYVMPVLCVYVRVCETEWAFEMHHSRVCNVCKCGFERRFLDCTEQRSKCVRIEIRRSEWQM